MKKNISRWLQDVWYQEMYISSALMPISMFYDDYMRFRRFLYRKGWLNQTKLPVPVIIVGNITVGGTGKTPLVLFLARLLRQEGFKPGIISRGYGGLTDNWPQWVDKQSQVAQVGDEAILMARRDCPVVVSPKRVEAAQMLLDKTDCNIIIADDGLQHYALGRDIEIAVIDGERRFGNGYALPCGPLREPIARLKEVDLVIVNGKVCEADELTFTVQGDRAINMVNQAEKALSDFRTTSVHAVAAIGNPQRFFDLLTQYGIEIETHSFEDHHLFQRQEVSFSDDKPVLMTEKDAVKCESFASLQHWYVPVQAQPEPAFVDKFITLINEKIRG